METLFRSVKFIIICFSTSEILKNYTPNICFRFVLARLILLFPVHFDFRFLCRVIEINFLRNIFLQFDTFRQFVVNKRLRGNPYFDHFFSFLFFILQLFFCFIVLFAICIIIYSNIGFYYLVLY